MPSGTERASENRFPLIRIVLDGDSPGLPPAGELHIRADDDGILYTIDPDGTIVELGSSGALAAHLADTTDAHDASAVSIADAGNNFTATDVEAALAELFAAIGGGGGGGELDYAQITAPVTVSATSEAGATTVVTGASVTYDGSTPIYVEAWFPYIEQDNSTNSCLLVLYDGSSSIGLFGILTATGDGNARVPSFSSRRLTPSAGAHTYSVRAWKDAGTAIVGAGAGGAAAHMPGYIRIREA